MRRPSRPPPRLDAQTVAHVTTLLEQRVRAVEAYGAGGCPTCHDAELRGAVARLRELTTGSAP